MNLSQLLAHDNSSRNAERMALSGLDSRIFEHPGDRIALDALRRVPFLDRMTAWVVDMYVSVEVARLASECLEVTEYTLPELHRVYRETAAILAISPLPPFFVETGESINAYTTGVDDPIVVLSSGAAWKLSEPELAWLLGHELGHVMAGHVQYSSMASAMFEMGDALSGTIPLLGDIAQLGINATLAPALAFWSRRSELTADRAGALACQDWDAAWRTMIKFMGHPINAYDRIDPVALFRQVDRYRKHLAGSFTARVGENSAHINQSHPAW